MKIAQVAPLAESVPPKLYGGTERIVSYLTEELVRQGHEVTLFASGDSLTKARLVSCSDVALRLSPAVTDHIPYLIAMLEEVRSRAGDFDVLHFHVDLLHFPMIQQLTCPTVTTLHGRLDLPDLLPLYRRFPQIPLVSISDHQRRPMPKVLWMGTIYHGLPAHTASFVEKPTGDYLAFLGRISPEKRADRAIEIASRAGMPLKMAAKIDNVDREYWQTMIEPMVKSHRNIEFVGEIDEQQKVDFLGNAGALLFPIDWPEPFGLVMIEAMACGTPVIAFRCGSVPEIIENGVSGFVVESVEEAADKVKLALRLDRRRVRAAFERRFTAERMAADYLDLYRQLPGVYPQAERPRSDQPAGRQAD